MRDKTPPAAGRAALYGALAGAVIVGLDMVPAFSYRSFLFLSFASGTLGIWGLFSLLLISRSKSPKAAALNVFLFLAAMTAAFYGVECVRDSIEAYQVFQHADQETLRILKEEGIETWVCFNWSLTLHWIILSFFSAVGAYFIARWRGKIGGTLVAAVPMAAMANDAVYYTVSLFTLGVGFAPAVINAAGFAYCALRFFRRKWDRILVITLSLIAAGTYVFLNYPVH